MAHASAYRSSAISAAARAAPSAVDRPVVDLAPDLLGDRGGDLVRAVGLEVHAAPGAVALEPVADVEVLLEVVPEREVEERPPVRGQLHRRRQAALDDREVAGGEVAVEVVDVGADLEPVVRGQRAGSIRGPATTIIRSVGDALASPRGRRRSRAAAGAPPTPEPPTVTMQTRSSGA